MNVISRGDFFGGLTAAVVALPLALAFGVASGAGAAAGLYGAIAVGFFAALFGGTPSQVSGPTGPMTVVMAAILTQTIAQDPTNGMAIAFTTVMLAGLLQIIAGKLKLGRYFVMVPFPVVSGFMSGIGIIIILLEIGPLIGGDHYSNPLAALLALPLTLSQLSWDAAFLGLGTLVLLFLWPNRFQVLPAPLMALIAFALFSLGSPFDGVERIGEIPRGLPDLHLPYIAVDLLPAIVGSAFLLAALGSIDSLLTSLVADNLTRTQHDSDRELIGQGIGNCVAGLIGGLPGAGATMRTLVNIRLGGRTRISGMLHSVLLAILMLGAAPLGEAIPLAVLAGILLKTGFDIIDWSFLCRLHRVPVFASALMLVVLVVTVTVDLITAVAIGVFVANLETLYRLSEMQLTNLVAGASSEELHNLSAQEEALLKQAEGEILVYQLDGFMSYGLSRGIARHFSQFSDHQVLIIDFSEVSHVDLSAALTLTEMVEDSKIRHRDVMLSGMSAAVLQSLKATDIDQLIPLGDRFTDRALAIEAAINRLPGMPSIQSGFGSAV
jgi:sulfate permease, SulP family